MYLLGYECYGLISLCKGMLLEEGHALDEGKRVHSPGTMVSSMRGGGRHVHRVMMVGKDLCLAIQRDRINPDVSG